MESSIDIDIILSPVAGDNPGGENLRYTHFYEDIKEALNLPDLPAHEGVIERRVIK